MTTMMQNVATFYYNLFFEKKKKKKIEKYYVIHQQTTFTYTHSIKSNWFNLIFFQVKSIIKMMMKIRQQIQSKIRIHTTR